MKLITTSFILFLTICIVLGENVKKCPSLTFTDGKGCHCYEPSRYMVCNGIDKDWMKSFNPDKVYEIDTLVIRDSPDFPLLSEHFSDNKDTKKGITYQSLIISLNSDPKFEKHVLDELVAGATTKIEIKINLPGNKLTIDSKKFQDSLTSISFSNVKLSNFKENAFTSLQNVQSLFFDNVDLGVDVTKINMPAALTRIEIINSPSFSGSFKYVPHDCEAEKQIEIILKNNKNLNDFDTSEMFKDEKCKYFVDLTGVGLNEDYLIKNAPKFIKDTKKPDNLFIIFRDVKLKCDYCVQKWYKSRESYLHSIKCSDKDKFIDELILPKDKYTKDPNDHRCDP